MPNNKKRFNATVFRTVTELTGIAIPPDQQTDEVRKVLEALSRLATTDVKTGIPNARAMDEILTQRLAMAKSHESARERRREAPKTVSFVAIDLDGFKGINDTLRHEAGDAALKYFADFMKKRLRRADTIARLGGDEFGVLMEADEKTAMQIIDRLRKGLAKEPFEYEGKTPPMSFSFGVHEITAQDEDIAAIKDDADQKAIADKEGKAERLQGAHASKVTIRRTHPIKGRSA